MYLADVLKSAPRTIYATVDGALMENAPDQLDSAGLTRWPLYRGVLEDAGIHLVALPSDAHVDLFLGLFGDTLPPAVFWSWPGSQETIFRHLRGIGKVEVPKPGTGSRNPEYEQVVFRHADPNSLIRVLRVLTDEQRETFLGEARGIVLKHFHHLGGSQIVRMPRDGRLLTGVPSIA